LSLTQRLGNRERFEIGSTIKSIHANFQSWSRKAKASNTHFSDQVRNKVFLDSRLRGNDRLADLIFYKNQRVR
jgi:hypothetical protein